MHFKFIVTTTRDLLGERPELVYSGLGPWLKQENVSNDLLNLVRFVGRLSVDCLDESAVILEFSPMRYAALETGNVNGFERFSIVGGDIAPPDASR